MDRGRAASGRARPAGDHPLTGILQALAFVTMVFLAMVGANALDTKLSACAARAGFIEVVLP